MQLGLINSAWAQAGKATSYGIQKTKEIGFDCIDIFADPLDTDAKERRLIRWFLRGWLLVKMDNGFAKTGGLWL